MNRTSNVLSLLFASLVLCTAACSSSSSSLGHSSDGATRDSSDASTNGCAPANNPAGCPSQYSHDYDGESCPAAGLSCKYPGESDNYGSCGDYALLDCGETDAGSTTWAAAQ